MALTMAIGETILTGLALVISAWAVIGAITIVVEIAHKISVRRELAERGFPRAKVHRYGNRYPLLPRPAHDELVGRRGLAPVRPVVPKSPERVGEPRCCAHCGCDARRRLRFDPLGGLARIEIPTRGQDAVVFISDDHIAFLRRHDAVPNRRCDVCIASEFALGWIPSGRRARVCVETSGRG